MSSNTLELQTAAELNLFDVDPGEGKVLSVFPPAREYYQDPTWYDTGGRDQIDQRRIFHMPAGEEQNMKLKEVLGEFPYYGPKILEKAAKHGKEDIIVALLDMGVNLELKVAEDAIWPLHFAAYQGNLGCVKVLIERGKLTVDLVDDTSATPLCNAARGGHHDIVSWLLQKGADPTFKQVSGEGYSVLEHAALSGSARTLEVLLDSPLINEKDASTQLMLVYACVSGKVEMLDLVLKRGGYPVDDPADGTWKGTRLTTEQRKNIMSQLWRVTMVGPLESLNNLLSYLTPRDKNGNFQYIELEAAEKPEIFNATEDAIESGFNDIFRLAWDVLINPPASILEAHPELKPLQHEWLHRRLISATNCSNMTITKLLIEEYHADPNHISMKYHLTPLFSAASSGNLELLRYLLEEHDVDIQTGCGQYANGPTALHMAVLNGQIEAAKLLLKHGGPLESVGKALDPITEDETLYLVAFKNFRAPVKLLTTEEAYEVTGDNHRCVHVEVSPEDMQWISKLQVRKEDKMLKEEGEKARVLMVKGWDLNDSKTLSTADWLVKMGLQPA